MSATQVGWKGETAAADDGSGAFTSVTLSPKRLTGKFPVSLELLAQDTLGVENMIRQDIVNAINEKLEATILGAGAGDRGKKISHAAHALRVLSHDLGVVCNRIHCDLSADIPA